MAKLIKRSFHFYLLFILLIFTLLPIQAMAESENEPVLDYVSLGDSLAAGFLNGVPPEEKLKGYPDFIQEGLQEQLGYHVELTNAGVGGYRTDNVYDDLKNNKDNIMESIEEADFITLGAGANDILQAVMDDLVNIDPNNPEEIQALVAKATAAIGQVEEYTEKILEEIKAVNPNAHVYVLGYYNALPYLDDLQEAVIPMIHLLNDTIEGVTVNKGAVFIPTFEAFDGKHETYLPDPDDIHPTEEGYQVIANLFLEEISQDIDQVKPEITLIGDSPMEMMVGDEYVEPGAAAEDDVDGDLTDDIEIDGEVDTDKPGEYEVTYTVKDEAGNEAKETRNVIVKKPEEEDTEAPEMTLNGDKEMELEVGEEYEEPGAKAEDDVDGDLTDAIEVSGEVDTNEPGEYQITYTVEDEAGNKVEEIRTVTVAEENESGVWFSGKGDPADETGDVGDFYLNEETGDYYKKTDSGWNEIGLLKDGDGATWFVGNDEPGEGIGTVDSLYVDREAGGVYLKSAEGWDLITTLEGKKKNEDNQGDHGASGDCDCNDHNNNRPSNGDNSGNGVNIDKTSTDKDKQTKTKSEGLPSTASNTPLFILIGKIIVIIGSMFLFIRKKAIL